MSITSETLGPNGEATIYCGDCLEILPTLGEVDAVVTDPPYGIKYVSRRKRGPTAPIANDDSPIAAESSNVIWKALRQGGAAYIATRFDVLGEWMDALRTVGFAVKTPIVWDKGNHTSGDLEGDYGAQVEVFLFAHRGRHILRGPRLANLWRFPREVAGDHPTPKPVPLMAKMIRCSTDIGHVVLDPFMGSGTTGVACAQLGRRFLGIEIEPKYYDIARRRIEQAYAQPRLFDEEEPKPQPEQSKMFEEAR